MSRLSRVGTPRLGGRTKPGLRRLIPGVSSGLLIVLGVAGVLILAAPASAVGSYSNAYIADKALSYVGQWGGNATREAGRSGATGAYTMTPQAGDGQCRAFVNEIVWIASGHSQWTAGHGSGAFADFLYYGSEITDASRLVKGDIVQKYVSSKDLHTFIIVSRASGNTFNVVDSNWNYDLSLIHI